MLVAIDGTAGSGKSSTAERVAEVTGFVQMDSGLMYRAIAWACIKHHIKVEEPAIADLLDSIQVEVGHIGSKMRMFVNGADVTDHLRETNVSEMASRVAQFAVVRNFLLVLQRGLGERCGRSPGLIAEGRDMGTVVFPDADLKFFFTASAAVRARRRFQQLKELGLDASINDLQSSLVQRDRADSEREIAPLKQHPDAVTINTDQLTLDSQVAIVLDKIRGCAQSM